MDGWTEGRPTIPCSGCTLPTRMQQPHGCAPSLSDLCCTLNLGEAQKATRHLVPFQASTRQSAKLGKPPVFLLSMEKRMDLPKPCPRRIQKAARKLFSEAWWEVFQHLCFFFSRLQGRAGNLIRKKKRNCLPPANMFAGSCPCQLHHHTY